MLKSRSLRASRRVPEDDSERRDVALEQDSHTVNTDTERNEH